MERRRAGPTLLEIVARRTIRPEIAGIDGDVIPGTLPSRSRKRKPFTGMVGVVTRRIVCQKATRFSAHAAADRIAIRFVGIARDRVTTVKTPQKRRQDSNGIWNCRRIDGFLASACHHSLIACEANRELDPLAAIFPRSLRR
jgi:hypothetical protein